jgi:hypothetical protein
LIIYQLYTFNLERNKIMPGFKEGSQAPIDEVDPIEASAAKAEASPTGENRLTPEEIDNYWNLESDAERARLQSVIDGKEGIEAEEKLKLAEQIDEVLDDAAKKAGVVGAALMAAGIIAAISAGAANEGIDAMNKGAGIMVSGAPGVAAAFMRFKDVDLYPNSPGHAGSVAESIAGPLRKARNFLWGTDSDYDGVKRESY